MSIPHLLRFRDLQERGIVNNRVTLKGWIDKGLFPEGRRTGPNTRTWTDQEVADYLTSCPIERKPAPPRRKSVASPALREPEAA